MPSTRTRSAESLPTTTSITWSGRWLLRPTVGRSTMPVVISGAVTMLISLIVRRRLETRWLTAGMSTKP